MSLSLCVCVRLLGDAAASDTESEAGDGDESTSGGPAHDASSTATVGSNPLYLSDQARPPLSLSLSLPLSYFLPLSISLPPPISLSLSPSLSHTSSLSGYLPPC